MTEIARENVTADVCAAIQPRTYIAVTFWGEEYRRYFLDFCLASLMAPGNIPAIEYSNTARLLVATRDDDWQALQTEPTFVAVKKYIAVEHVRHEAPLNTPHSKKMYFMSQGHKLLAQRMFEDRARGVIVYPDMILADGALRRIEQLASSGYKVILCLAVRFANEGLIDELRFLKLIEPGKPLAISPEELVRLTIKHMHSEAVRLEFDADLNDQAACSFFWVVTPGQNLLFHCANWAPLLIDYGAVSHHDDSTFDEWTLDGDYVAKNFADIADIYVVRNTTELFISCFTPESKVSFSKMRLFPYRFASLRTPMKIVRAREYMDSFDILDDVKKRLFRVPIRVQGGAATEIAWREAELRAATIVERMNDLSVRLKICYFFWSIVRRCLTRILRFRRRLREVVHRRRGPQSA